MGHGFVFGRQWMTSLLLVYVGCGPSMQPGGDPGPMTFPVVDSGTTSPTPIPSPESCASAPGADSDGDGFPAGSDCNDCSAQINPGAFDLPGNGIDEDCSGVDDVEMACDVGLAMTSTSAEDAARAMGLCKFVSETDPGWGVISARFTLASGTGAPVSMEQVGLLPSFGTVQPPQGGSMLALSSGTARDPSQPGYTPDCDTFGIARDANSPTEAPVPVPIQSPSCPGGSSGDQIMNSVALELRVRVPTNASGYAFNSNFFTYQYPGWICDRYNDYFAAMRLNSTGTWENILFDQDGNSVSVNSSLLQVCRAGTHGGRAFACPQGIAMLTGTGYDGTATCGMNPWPGEPSDFGPDRGYDRGPPGAATGWLRTVAPATGGEIITLRIAIWDAGDPDLDSLALVDGWQWEVGATVPPTPMTSPLI